MNYVHYQILTGKSTGFTSCNYQIKKSHKINLKDRIKLFKQGRIPFIYPTLKNRMFFAKNNKHAHKAFKSHPPHQLNKFQIYFYLITGKVIGKTKTLIG